MYQKNVLFREMFKWEINANNPVNTTTGTIPIFSAPANTVIQRVSALVETAITGYSAQTAAYTAFNVTTNVITKSAHGYKTGTVVQVSTTDTLPTGISASTDYYVLYQSASTFKLTNAAGTVIDFSDQGAGNHTFTPTTLVTEVGDGTDPNGYLLDAFAGSTGLVGENPSDDKVGAYLTSSGAPLTNYYSAADTIDFVITGQAITGKVTFFIDFYRM